MPANNVDLTAILPVLKEAVAPFEAARIAADRIKVNPGTAMRNFAPLGGAALADVWKLLDAVQAVRRVAGDIK